MAKQNSRKASGAESSSRTLSFILWPLIASQALVILAAMAIVCFGLFGSNFKPVDRFMIVTPAISAFGLSAAALGGFLTLLAAVAPRWLSQVGLGPRLVLEWLPDDGGYTHEWNRDLRIGTELVKTPAVIVRVAVRNEGLAAAELVQVKLAKIVRLDGQGSTPLPHAKFSPLRWADSYDLDEFEGLKHHRCGNVVEPLIHAGATQFFDFGFIFAPGAYSGEGERCSGMKVNAIPG